MRKSNIATARIRVAMLAIATLVYGVCLVVVGTPVMLFLLMPPWTEEGARKSCLAASAEVLVEPEWWLWGAMVAIGVLFTQLLFLLPVVRTSPPGGRGRHSLAVSLVAGGVVAVTIMSSLGLGLIELAGNLLAGDFSVNPWSQGDLLSVPWVWPGLVLVVIGTWIGWTVMLLVFARELWTDTLVGRAALLLFGGTVVELLIVLPIDVMVRRRTDCYCAAGTFWSLVMSAVAIMWLTGPGIVLTLTRSRRRLARVTHCGRCGHEKGPTPGEVCPECGFRWAVDRPAASRR